MSDLTPRQAATVEAIRSFTQRHGYAPTTREIGRLVGVRSTNAVLEMVERLERKGVLTRGPKGMPGPRGQRRTRARSLVVTGEPAPPAIVDMGDGTVHVAATVRLEDVDALVARIRDVAAAAARRSA